MRADGHAEPPIGKVSRLLLRRGDLIRLVTGTGGGYGDPREREPALVRADLRDGLITAADAAEVYGVGPGEAGMTARRASRPLTRPALGLMAQEFKFFVHYAYVHVVP